MLSRESAEALISILSNEIETLGSLANKFAETFETKERMIALTAISVLLSDGILDHQQQIVGLWLLYSEFESIPLCDSPFYPIYTYLDDVRKNNPNMCSPQLYDILSCILSNTQPEQVTDCSVRVLFGPTFVINTPKSVSMTTLKVTSPRLSPILVEKTTKPVGPILSQSEVLIELLCNCDIYTDFESPFMRPAPAVSPIFPGELFDTFMSSYTFPPALFDECVSIDSKETAISMIHKAAEGKLKPAEIESLSRELGKSPELAAEAKLPVNKIESMVNATPIIAKDMFRILCVKEPALVKFLARTPITETLADIAKEVLKNRDLPGDLFGAYIEGQLTNVSGKDQQTCPKKRTEIALLCGMLCDVIRDGVKIEQGVLDLYSLCSDNLRISEAGELLKLMGT